MSVRVLISFVSVFFWSYVCPNLRIESLNNSFQFIWKPRPIIDYPLSIDCKLPASYNRLSTSIDCKTPALPNRLSYTIDYI